VLTLVVDCWNKARDWNAVDRGNLLKSRPESVFQGHIGVASSNGHRPLGPRCGAGAWGWARSNWCTSRHTIDWEVSRWIRGRYRLSIDVFAIWFSPRLQSMCWSLRSGIGDRCSWVTVRLRLAKMGTSDSFRVTIITEAGAERGYPHFVLGDWLPVVPPSAAVPGARFSQTRPARQAGLFLRWWRAVVEGAYRSNCNVATIVMFQSFGQISRRWGVRRPAAALEWTSYLRAP